MEDRRPILGGLTAWRSIYIASGLSFVGAVQFSLYFAALWPYMKILDSDITESFYGWTVFVYSLGQVLSAPAFGWWSNRIRQVGPPLYAGLALMFLGNLVYILMEVTPLPKRFVLMFCRFLIGMGSGNVATLRSYAATASTVSERSRAIAFVTCGQAVGMTLGPAFQFAFTRLDYPGPAPLGLSLNLYTSPAYLACAMNAAGALVLYRFFEEKLAPDFVEEDEQEEDFEQERLTKQRPLLPMYDLAAVFVCYATRFTDMFVRTNLETLGSPFAMMMFSFNEADAVKYLSMAQGVVGVLTLLTYVVFISFDMEQIIPMRPGCALALALMLLFHLITYSWSFLPSQVHIMNGTSTGCDAQRFAWCAGLTRVNPWLYYGTYVLLIGTAFPLLTVTLTTLFSKVLGPRRQGTQQGLFQAASALGRMLGPVGASALYSAAGPRPVWQLEMGVLAGVGLAWLLAYRRMVPLRLPAPPPPPSPPPQHFGYENPMPVGE